MNNIWKDFWPTPESVFNEMYSIVDWDSVTAVLEPSAGKGNLIHFLKNKWSAEKNRRLAYNHPRLEAIEINPELRKTLQKDGVALCGKDFLQFNSHYPYDLVFGNPPFANGDEHLRHAISLMEGWGGGQIVFLLNSETINNPYSAGRKALAQKIQQYNAKVVNLGSAFSDAERPTDVNVSMVYICIPRTQKSSILYESYKKAVAQEECMHNPNELVERGTMESICQMFDHEVELGLKLIDEFSAVSAYLKDGDRNFFTLHLEDEEYAATKQNFVEKVRIKYWTQFFNNDDMAMQLTNNLRTDYYRRVKEEYRHYDFNMENIATAHLEMAENLIDGIKRTILNLFDEFTREYSWYPESKHNIHYFNGWRTNECSKVGEKVIIPLAGYRDLQYSWGGFLPTKYDVVDKLADIEKCLAFLDGEYKASRNNVEQALKDAEESGQSKNIMMKYFSVTFYKKGTCHIKFHDTEALKRFNVFAAQGKGWLPPSYGRKDYGDMEIDEQNVIDSFEGRASYTQTMKQPQNIALLNPQRLINLLPQKATM